MSHTWEQRAEHMRGERDELRERVQRLEQVMRECAGKLRKAENEEPVEVARVLERYAWRAL